MQIVSSQQAASMVRDLSYNGNGKIFSVAFIKRSTGESRHMNCRGQVKKGVNGTGLAFDPGEKGLISVYDMQSKGFRFISEESIQMIKANGEEYVVE
jgi:hypothetical protein